MEHLEDDIGAKDPFGVESINGNESSFVQVEEPGTPLKQNRVRIEVGLIFDSAQQIYETYNEYALYKGFGVRKRNSRLNYILLVCSRNGFGDDTKDMDDANSSQRSTSLTRCGCKAALSAFKIVDSELWQITRFSDIHNHSLVSPKSVTLLRSHKVYSAAAKCLTESFSRAGVPIARIPHVFGTTTIPFEVRDCYNHMKKIRTIIYEAGDAQAVQLYCTKKHEEDPNFFYSIQFDDDSRMMNFFWVDSMSRIAYEKFGDVVTFDTTYRTNKYSMPFAPFVGLNHHMQSVMFGCALLHDETEETFTWVFETWLSAMKGKAPGAIITDQDAAMGKAITRVFPKARHRLCIWHITKKFPEKLAHIYQEKSPFREEFNDVVYNSRSIEYFEYHWAEVITKYNLQDHGWLKGLYEIRTAWVPVFNRNTFFAGVSTTQRSESINAFFNNFVHSGMTLREFVAKYEVALATRYESYRREEFDSCHKDRKLVLNLALEEQAAVVYTRNVFSKFYGELSVIMKFSKRKLEKVGSHSTYQVWNRKDLLDDQVVSIDFSSKEVCCTCMKFEFMGILCRHIMTIFHAKDIEEIPARYILQRWRKDGNKLEQNITTNLAIEKVNMSMRCLSLRQIYGRLDEFAEKSDKAYTFMHGALLDIIATVAELVETDKETEENKDTCDNEIGDTPSIAEQSIILKDPQTSQTKGRKRIKSGVELSQKNRNTCGSCGQRGHNRRGCKQGAATTDG